MTLRDKIYLALFNLSENWYRNTFKKKVKAWKVSLEELKNYPKYQLGYKYYEFLTKNGVNILPKLESHDMLHVLTNTGTKVKDELALQYYMLGNGKRSIYQAFVLISSLFYLDRLPYFIKAFKNGKNSTPFHHLNFEEILNQPLTETIKKYNIKEIDYEN